MTKSECYLLAAQLGAVIHDDGNLVRLEAPRFKTVDIGVHEWHYDCAWGRENVWRDLGQDLKQGFQDCDDHLNRECDWCDEAEYK
jgi:hypothetical protein